MGVGTRGWEGKVSALSPRGEDRGKGRNREEKSVQDAGTRERGKNQERRGDRRRGRDSNRRREWRALGSWEGAL